MTTLREAAQQALEALEALDAPPSGVVDHYELDRRKQALRAALAQQEPVALCDPAEYDDFQGAVSRNCASANSPKRHAPVTMETVYETIIHWEEGGGKRSRRELARRIVDLYTTPPRREWHGLKEWEINDGRDQLPTEDLCGWSFRQGVYFAEKALKEKNA